MTMIPNVAKIKNNFLLRFMYLEEVEEGLLEQEVVTFLELGEQYQVNKLKELAEDRIVKILKKENMIEFLLAAVMFG